MGGIIYKIGTMVKSWLKDGVLMKDGFIKVAAATCGIRVADCAYNAENIIKAWKEASGNGAKLVVFPELCITGYTCGDLFLQETLLRGAVDALFEIAAAGKGLGTLCTVGLPLVYGGKLYNCAAVLYDGEILGVVPKSNIPNYSEFYEQRHFCAAPDENGEIVLKGQAYPFGAKLIFSCASIPAFTLGVEICEDLWVPQPPSACHALAGATVIANLSASDEVIGKADYRRSLVSAQSARLICGYVYADAGFGESTTDLVFSGHDLICENGTVLQESELFQDGIIYSEIDVERLAEERRRTTTFPAEKTEGYRMVRFDIETEAVRLTRPVARRPFVPENAASRARRCEEILAIQSEGLKKRMQHTGCKSIVVGISGGLDSCLALLVMVRAVGQLGRPASDIVAVTMPCFGTTKRTKSNAELLCDSLGVTLKTIDIADSVKQHFADIGHSEDNYNVVYENAQARERTQILMDVANQCGGLVIGTGDLSELALGWATYNGDHMSMYGVNASVPKTLVRHIVRYVADTADSASLKTALYDILDTPVSPELLPAGEDGTIAQKTEDLVGPYDLHDFFLYYMVRFGFSPAKIYRLCSYAYDGEYEKDTILYWMKVFYRRFFSQQFKRSCLPDGPKVGTVTLSPRGDWRMPSDASARLWLDEIDKL